MASEVDPKIIKASQDLLTKIVKKPAISEKLLKRPPFRFLHDLIISVSLSQYIFNTYSVPNLIEELNEIMFLSTNRL